MIESDLNVVNVAKQNAVKISQPNIWNFDRDSSTHHKRDASSKVIPDLVVMNPPWGVQTPKADRPLLEFAFLWGHQSFRVLHSAQSKHLQGLAEILDTIPKPFLKQISVSLQPINTM